MTLVQHECPTLPENLSQSPVSSGVRVARSLVFCAVFCRSLFVLFYFFLFAIVLSVLRFTDSEYIFGIFWLYPYSILRNYWTYCQFDVYMQIVVDGIVLINNSTQIYSHTYHFRPFYCPLYSHMTLIFNIPKNLTWLLFH